MEMNNLKIQKTEEGIVFLTKVIPGSSTTLISGLLDGILKVKVSAAPEKGKANQSLKKFLAKQLNVKNNAIDIISGQTSPVKQIRVVGISAETLLEKLNLE
jgi:uncharacterized protein (TIGR00251 family)